MSPASGTVVDVVAVVVLQAGRRASPGRRPRPARCDSIERLLVVGPLGAFSVRGLTVEISWNTTILHGAVLVDLRAHAQVRPTSLRSMVVNGFTEPLAAPVLVYWPVTKGTFWPITILASSLSRVSRLGVDSTVGVAVAGAAGRSRSARSRRCTCVPCRCCEAAAGVLSAAGVLPPGRPSGWRMLAPDRLELVPTTPLLPTRRSATGHRTCAALLALTSTISASTMTCARRPSSRSITARSCRYCGSRRVMMSELVDGSAWIWPPVDGWLALLTGAVATLLAPPLLLATAVRQQLQVPPARPRRLSELPPALVPWRLPRAVARHRRAQGRRPASRRRRS